MVPKSLRPLVPYLKRYRRGLLLGGICVLFNNGVWILFPQVIRKAVNGLNGGVTREKLATYALMVIGVALDAWMLVPGWVRGETTPHSARNWQRCTWKGKGF